MEKKLQMIRKCFEMVSQKIFTHFFQRRKFYNVFLEKLLLDDFKNRIIFNSI